MLMQDLRRTNPAVFLDHHWALTDLPHMFAELDDDGSGQLSRTEFLGWWKERTLETVEKTAQREAGQPHRNPAGLMGPLSPALGSAGLGRPSQAQKVASLKDERTSVLLISHAHDGSESDDEGSGGNAPISEINISLGSSNDSMAGPGSRSMSPGPSSFGASPQAATARAARGKAQQQASSQQAAAAQGGGNGGKGARPSLASSTSSILPWKSTNQVSPQASSTPSPRSADELV